MIRLTTFLAIAIVAILGSGCGLEESYIPDPTDSSATEPTEAAPDPSAVVKGGNRSSVGYLPADNPAPSRADEPTRPESSGDTSLDANRNESPDGHDNTSSDGTSSDDSDPDGSDPDGTVRQPNLPPNKRLGPQTVEESKRLIAQFSGRIKIDLTSGKVVSVWLNRTDIDDFDLRVFQTLTDLQVLNLTGTRVSDKGLAQLHHLKKLRRIYTQGTRITDEGLQSLRAKLPELRVMVFPKDVATE